jgi:GNAT superfamily N-acetyltransferase
MLTAKVGEHVAGFAYWAPPKATKIPRSLHLRILGGILSVYDTIKSFIYPKWLQKLVNPAAYQENLERAERREKIMAIDGDIKSRRFPAELDEGTCWTLVALGVSEDFSRRGIGSKLVQWGCDRADEDDRAIYVSASQEGTHLYLKHGFDVIHHEAECLYDPQRGWVEQTYLIRWQKSRRVTKEKL